jgi:hypothetical protein
MYWQTRLNCIDMQISYFLNISIYYTETAFHFKLFFKLLNIKHGESSYPHELRNHLEGSQSH